MTKKLLSNFRQHWALQALETIILAAAYLASMLLASFLQSRRHRRPAPMGRPQTHPKSAWRGATWPGVSPAVPFSPDIGRASVEVRIVPQDEGKMLCIQWITHLAEANWGGDSVAGLMVAQGRGAVEA